MGEKKEKSMRGGVDRSTVCRHFKYRFIATWRSIAIDFPVFLFGRLADGNLRTQLHDLGEGQNNSMNKKPKVLRWRKQQQQQQQQQQKKSQKV